MDRQKTIIRVSFHEAPLAHQPQRKDFYFGCLAAIYDVFTPEQVGSGEPAERQYKGWQPVREQAVRHQPQAVRQKNARNARASEKFGQ